MSAIKRFLGAAQLRQLPQLSSDTRWLLALMLLAAAVRAIGIARPLLGNFATKNVVYAMIARNWATGASSVWYPSLDCLQQEQLSLHMLEFPVSAYLVGACWWLAGGSLELWGRAVSIGFSVAAVALLFLLARRVHSARVAKVAAAAYALAPVSVIYGQAFMLEASLGCFALAAMYAADRWCERPQWWSWALSSAALALALLTKIYLLVLLLPVAFALVRAVSQGRLYPRQAAWGAGAVALALVPAALWYGHAAQTAAADSPLQEQVFFSVRDSTADHLPPHPLLFEARFYGRLFSDLATVVLTPIGCMLAVLGLLRRDARRWLPWLVACAVLMLLLPRKFFEMNYYHLAVLAPLCLLVGLGWESARRWLPARNWQVAVATAACLLAVRYFARPAFVTPIEDRSVLAAAAAIQAHTAPDEVVATMHGSTFDLLYYSQRRGWFIAPDDPQLEAKLAEYRAAGARLLVVAETGDSDHERLSHLSCIERGPRYAVYALADGSAPKLAVRREHIP